MGQAGSTMSTAHTYTRLLLLLLGCSVLLWYWTQVVSGQFSENCFVNVGSVRAYSVFLSTFTYMVLCSALLMFSCPDMPTGDNPTTC